jgi:excinuclease ABC subunit C
MVREIYKVRSCNYRIDDQAIKKKKYKLCFDYHIKKCDGPCEGLITHEQYLAMIAEVAQVIKGKTSTLVKMLEEKMTKASEELRFEAAAELRDKIRQLQLYGEKQKIVDWEMVDRDLFALAMNGDDACGVIFQIRDGKIIGRQHFYMSHVDGRVETEIIEHLVERYYFETEDLPKEIFLPVELESINTLQEWLNTRSGDHIAITVPKIGEKAKLMAMCKHNAQFLLDVWLLKKEKQKDFIHHSVKALQRDIRLPKLPRRIECFDISNIQGSDSVASMVVFVDGKARKSEYRKYKIKSVDGPNDFASMHEVVERRYTRVLAEQAELPDLIMVDGGKGQLSSAVEVLRRLGLHKPEQITGENTQPNVEVASQDSARVTDVPIIGLAKRLEEVFLPDASEAQTVPKTSSGLKLLQQIRDEAHRFAITYHRSLRTKRTLQTELDLIAGVGKKRAKELLEVFGSVQGVKFATSEQLEEIVGQKVATKIREYFSEDDAETS